MLAIYVQRRIRALALWTGVVFLSPRILRIQNYGLALTIGVYTGTVLALVRLFARIVVIERRMFCCHQCGCALQGLTEHRCPECGALFDPTEKRRIEERNESPLPKSKIRRIAVALIVILTGVAVAHGIVL